MCVSRSTSKNGLISNGTSPGVSPTERHLDHEQVGDYSNGRKYKSRDDLLETLCPKMPSEES